ncbi:hypothetical protein QBC41DRAFT_287338 [Cercophora samala]|uniref:Uncharacterized protein n=1 Tax=Cercophora samala TaxID=330535 RepID=A0AA39YV11_9PEZI|nr:hypothetical protein QBC41DRAFT_287338 [Cercophora samala]
MIVVAILRTIYQPLRFILNYCKALYQRWKISTRATLARPEAAKKYSTSSWKAILKRLLAVHFLPSFVTLFLVILNSRGYFIGSELEGEEGRDGLKLGVLQVASKVHELLVLASLSTVLFDAVRYELVFGQGLPLGLIGAGFSFTSVGYFFSFDFWAGVFDRSRSWRRKILFLALLVTAGFLGLLAGPTSAVLMIPRELDWAAGGGYIWINKTTEQLWPDTFEGSSLNCDVNPWYGKACIASGFEEIQNNIKAWAADAELGATTFDIRQRRDYRKLHVRTRPLASFQQETWAFTTDDSLATIQGILYDVWANALREHNATTKGSSIKPWNREALRLGRASTRTATVQAELPAVRVVCANTVKQPSYPAAEILLDFPVLPEFDRFNRFSPEFQIVNVTEVVNKRMAEVKSGDSVISPENQVVTIGLHLPRIARQSASLGIVVISTRKGPKDGDNVLACSVDARFVRGKSIIQQHRSTGIQPTGVDNERKRVTIDCELEVDSLWPTLLPQDDEIWRRVNITTSWLGLLNDAKRAPDDGSEKSQASIDSILNTTRTELGFQYFLEMWRVEFALALTIVDGLSRSSTYRQENTSILLGPISDTENLVYEGDWSESRVREWAKRPPVIEAWIRRGEPSDSYRPHNPRMDSLTEVKMNMELNGYAIAFVGWFDYFSMTVLLIHVAIAFFHLVWVCVFVRPGNAGQAWESISELIALALNSQPPQLHPNGEHSFENTCAGIAGYVPPRQIGWVEDVVRGTGGQAITPRNGTEQLQLRFGRARQVANGKRQQAAKLSPGQMYGKA